MLVLLLACRSPTVDLPDDAPWEDVEGSVSAALQDALEAAQQEQGSAGMAVAVAFHDDRTLWTGATGLADVDGGVPWTPELQTRIGSVTKLHTATVVHQLVSEGRLGLDDRSGDWIDTPWPEVPVRELLGMSSGIVSYNYVGSFDATAAWTPQELVDWAEQHEPGLRFAPGSDWEYSNTNYVLLGQLIEAVLEQPYEEVLADRFFAPLALTSFELAGAGHTLASMRSYDESGDEVLYDPSFGWAAGSLAASPADVARVADALFLGGLLDDEARLAMTTPRGLTGPDQTPYGLGAFVEADESFVTHGHTGGIGGHLTYCYTLQEPPATVVVATNQLGVNLNEAAAAAWRVVIEGP